MNGRLFCVVEGNIRWHMVHKVNPGGVQTICVNDLGQY